LSKNWTARSCPPSGGTALHVALSDIAPLRPKTVVVISDGEPDHAPAALDAARRLCCRIGTYFCGDERNHAAVAFLRALSWASADGFGRAAVADLRDPRTTPEHRAGKMTRPDPEKLLNVFARAASEFDGEALTALRMGQRLAAESGLTLLEALQKALEVRVNVEIDLTRLAQLEEDA
jgi:hypothetical protein